MESLSQRAIHVTTCQAPPPTPPQSVVTINPSSGVHPESIPKQSDAPDDWVRIYHAADGHPYLYWKENDDEVPLSWSVACPVFFLLPRARFYALHRGSGSDLT